MRANQIRAFFSAFYLHHFRSAFFHKARGVLKAVFGSI